MPIFSWHAEPWFAFKMPEWEPTLKDQLMSVTVRAFDPLKKCTYYPASEFPVVEAAAAAYFPEQMGNGAFKNFLLSAPTLSRRQIGDDEITRRELVKRGKIMWKAGESAMGVACHGCGQVPPIDQPQCTWVNGGRALCFRCGHG